MQRISNILEDLWQAPAWKRALKAGHVLERWPELVGKVVARAARPRGFARGVLTLEVYDHIWLQRLRFEERKILKLLNETCGEKIFERLRLVLRSEAWKGSPSRKRREIPENIKRAIEKELALIEDEELRRAFLKLRLTLARKKLQLP
jgi:predicted nucleic acid-binding Zn ribbon protein